MNGKGLKSLYSWRFPRALAYMLQASEYRTPQYLKWLLRTRDFSRVQYRRTLERTIKAKLLEIFLATGMTLEIIVGLVIIGYGISSSILWLIILGFVLIIAYPLIWALLVVLPLEAGRLLVVLPAQQREITASEKIFAEHPGIKIAVAGSYGKTTMKELLKTVLSEGKTVAATIANNNVSTEHAKFAKRLKGNEEVLIIEYGEGAPGDVKRFTRVTKPTYGFITGLAPAHIDKYKTLKVAGDDIFSLADFLQDENIYVNADSLATKEYLKEGYKTYSENGVGKWKVKDVKISIEGTSFRLLGDNQTINIHSKLIGRHQIGALSASAALAIDLGLSIKEIEFGIAKCEPFEHRMQPRYMSGAWIIDDSYNGNIEGIKAGTALLKELPAKRKIYVTPGLVDQGTYTQEVHLEMGHLIASADPNLVVLINNSVTDYIRDGLNESGFKGELQIVNDPLAYYSNLEQTLALGDLLMMQNDWPDNYV